MGVTLRKCMHCRERAVSPSVGPYSAEMEHDGRKYLVEIPDFEVLRCENCGSVVLDDAASDRLFDALRQKAGLLAPAEIRGRREALGRKQRELAALLQISESTLSRWETGAQMQQRCMDTLLRGFFGVPEFRHFLGMAGPAPVIEPLESRDPGSSFVQVEARSGIPESRAGSRG